MLNNQRVYIYIYVLNMVILHSYAALTYHFIAMLHWLTILSLGLRKPSRMSHVITVGSATGRGGYQLLPTMTGWWYTYPIFFHSCCYAVLACGACCLCTSGLHSAGTTSAVVIWLHCTVIHKLLFGVDLEFIRKLVSDIGMCHSIGKIVHGST